MALTEIAKEEIKAQELKNLIQICEEAIEKSEKYERLSDNKDWKGYMEDLQILINLHDREIKFGINLMTEAPNSSYAKSSNSGEQQIVSSKQDWSDFIIRHQVVRDELDKWIKEPDRIIEMSRQAREKLPILKEKLTALMHGGNNVSREPVEK